MAGVELPVIPAHHQYVITTTIPEVRDLGYEPPVIRDLDGEENQPNNLLFCGKICFLFII